MVVMDKRGAYTRVVSPAKGTDGIQDNEVILYTDLYANEAKGISQKFNKVHSAISKGIFRDYLGLLNSFGLIYGQEPDDTSGFTEVKLFYGHYGIGAFVNQDLPDDVWEIRILYVSNDDALKFIQNIMRLDKINKHHVYRQSLKEADNLYNRIMDQRHVFVSLDSIAQ